MLTIMMDMCYNYMITNSHICNELPTLYSSPRSEMCMTTSISICSQILSRHEYCYGYNWPIHHVYMYIYKTYPEVTMHLMQSDNSISWL